MMFPQFEYREEGREQAKPSKYVTGYCVPEVEGDHSEESWPTKFVAVPKEGEFVQSAAGNILKVIRVIHMIDPELMTPTIEVSLGRDVSGGISPLPG